MTRSWPKSSGLFPCFEMETIRPTLWLQARAKKQQERERLRLDIPGIRPAVLREPDAFKNLDELRGFRHIFRHAYSYGLDDERIFFLVNRVLRSKDTLLKDTARFRSDVDAMLQSEQD